MPILPIFHVPNIEAGRFIYALSPAWARSWPTRMCFTKCIEIQKKAKIMWKPGDIIAWRGIANNRPWHVQAGIVVNDSTEELVVTFLPDADGRRSDKRRWEFKGDEWTLTTYIWQANRVLALTEPEKFYSIMLFWNQESNDFLGYYVNFQLPFTRSHCGIDTLDLDLDIDIEPDLGFRWKDEEDYQTAIDHSLITPEWVQGIEMAKPEILERIKKRQYPFDGSWLSWMPDASWSPPKLPENWDKI
jgi:predicted RNA-binding protein associated with RNAse of E/G family